MNLGKLHVEITADSTRLQSGLNKADQAIKSTAKNANTLGGTTVGTSKNFDQFGRSAGMASIQLQQFIGQVSGGVNPMIALSQQGADLGFVLGAPLLGSVVGISAALGTMLLPALFDSKNAMEELEAASELLKKSVNQTDIGVYELSEQIRNLSVQGGKALEAELVAGMVKAEGVIKASSAAIVESFKGLDGVGFGLFDVTGVNDYVDALNNVNKSSSVNIQAQEGFIQTSRELGEQFGLTGEEARKAGRQIIVMLAELDKAPSAEGLRALQEQLASLITSSGKSSKEIILLTSRIQEMTAEGIAAGEMAKFLQENINNIQSDNGDIIDPNIVKTAKTLSEELQIVQEELANGEQAAARLALALSLGKGAFSELPQNIKNSVIEMEKLEAIKREQEQADRDAIKATTEAEREARRTKQEEEREARRARVEEEIKARQVIRDYESTMGQVEQDSMTDLEKIQADFEAKRELLISHAALLHQDEMLDAEQRKAINQQLQNDLNVIEENAAKKRAEFAKAERDAKIATVGQMFGDLSSLMNTGSRKMFAVGKAAAKAQSVVSTLTGMSKSLELGWPLGPIAAAAIGVKGFANVRQINAQQFGGAGGGATSFVGGLPSVNTNQGGGFNQQATSPQRNVSINLQGSLFSADQVRSLIGQINEQIGDGVVIAGR